MFAIVSPVGVEVLTAQSSQEWSLIVGLESTRAREAGYCVATIRHPQATDGRRGGAPARAGVPPSAYLVTVVVADAVLFARFGSGWSA
jgi:hypothetical protein